MCLLFVYLYQLPHNRDAQSTIAMQRGANLLIDATSTAIAAGRAYKNQRTSVRVYVGVSLQYATALHMPPR